MGYRSQQLGVFQLPAPADLGRLFRDLPEDRRRFALFAGEAWCRYCFEVGDPTIHARERIRQLDYILTALRFMWDIPR